MPPILTYYVAGLSVALAIGIVCYYVVGFAATPLWQALFGAQSGRMWGRLFRMSVVMVALVGALSTKFYGCGGPTDYDDVARDHRRMLELTSAQISGSLRDCAQYLAFVAGIAALALAAMRARRSQVLSASQSDEGPGESITVSAAPSLSVSASTSASGSKS